ncbi:MAG: alpha-glucan family phosphorylase [Blastocatellia bacterium]|nr:alpha-glucan family phosphorylase [Blastocatellia bacterium]
MHATSAMTRSDEFRQEFAIGRELPSALQALERISMNFFWSWRPEGVELFQELDPALWQVHEQHPRALLRNVTELRLWQKAADAEYVGKVERFAAELDTYMAATEAKIDVGTDISTDAPAAYFCAEYGVHNSLPNYSGGLGILAGDHLKSASDLNVPLVAVGLFYRFGYFRQNIAHDGWQREHYLDIFQSDTAVESVIGESDERVTVAVEIRGREVLAQAWKAQVGRVSLYLLDTNLPQNQETDRLITGHLYGGNAETRIVQEKVLGIGGVRLLRKLEIAPAVYHLNEGHSAFLTLELAREQIIETGSTFAEAAGKAGARCVFTTHTPVAAGNDVFQPSLLRQCFSDSYLSELKLTEEEFFALGRVEPDNVDEPFGMTPFALRMTRSANGVSEKHGEVSRELWAEMFDGSSPITHVTNGVHPPTWIAPGFQRMFAEKIGNQWHEKVRDASGWATAVSLLSDEDIWHEHLRNKNLLIAFLRERSKRREIGLRDTINERLETSDLFSADVLTIGFARRVAQYKRWDLLLSDLERLLKLVDHPERPVQFLFAGKAHPQDDTAKRILQELMSINHDSNWQKRAVFIEDYDQEVARYLVHGVDVWMNVPRRPYEASGTSGMKAAMNGVLNLSILDGWWIEGDNGINGFSIESDVAGGDEAGIDVAEAEAFYSKLEDEIVPLFYDKGGDGSPHGWIARMRNSIETLTPAFSSDRMVSDYFQRIYKK